MRHPKPFVVLQPVAGETKPLFTVYAYTLDQARAIVAGRVVGETIVVDGRNVTSTVKVSR